MRTLALILLALALGAPARADTAPPLPESPAVLAALGAGHAALARGDAEGALAAFDEAAATAPLSARAQQGRGAAFVALGRTDDALAAFKAALRMAPEDGDLRLDLATTYLLAGNAAWAVRTLATPFPPEDPERETRRTALLAWALVEAGQGKEAAALVRERGFAPEDGPAGADVAALERLAVGRVELDGGAPRVARQLFDASEGLDTDPALLDASGALVAVALRADDREATWYAASAATGLEFDSNALYAPRDAPAGDERSDPSAGRSYLRAALTARPVTTGRHLLAGDAGFYRSFHFGNEDARQLDLTEVTGGVRYAVRLVTPTVEHTLQARYRFQLDLLEGGDLLAEPDRFVFLESHGGELAWTHTFVDQERVLRGPAATPGYDLELRVAYGVDRRLFAEMGREAWMHQLGVRPTLRLLDGRLRLQLDLGGRADEARASRYELVGVTAGAQAAGVVFAGIELVGTLTYAHHDYFDSEGLFDTTRPSTRRIDDALTVGALAGRVFLDGHLTVAAQYAFTRRFSSIPLYDYDRHVVSLLVGGRL